MGENKESEIALAAQAGDLDRVKAAVKAEFPNIEQHILSGAPPPLALRLIINRTQCWVESDDKGDWPWHTLTPAAKAAHCGSAEVLEYLLKLGADPFLRGCYDEDVYLSANTAVNHEPFMRQ